MRTRAIVLLLLGHGILLLNGCVLLQHEQLIPLRRLLHHNTRYWVDPVWAKGEPLREIEYYRNGQKTSERIYDESGRLVAVEYFSRQGLAIRKDTLRYDSENRLQSGIYFELPYPRQILRFENTFLKDQIASRRWFDRADTLVSLEQFFFDRRGRKVLRLIWSPGMDVRLLEVRDPVSGNVEFQNVYAPDSVLVSQTLYASGQAARRMYFDGDGRLVRIDHLGTESRVLWKEQFSYDLQGQTVLHQVLREDGLLLAKEQDPEDTGRQRYRWSHPAAPGDLSPVWRFDRHEAFFNDPPVREVGDSLVTRETRLRSSGQRLKRKVLTPDGQVLRDTLYGGADGPVLVIRYDRNGLVQEWAEIPDSLSGNRTLTLFRDPLGRIQREEVAQGGKFQGARTIYYDQLGYPWQVETSRSGGRLDGYWRHFQAGALDFASRHTPEGTIQEAYGLAPGGDSLFHYSYRQVEYFLVETGRDRKGHPVHQRRFTPDGLMDWLVELDSLGRPSVERRFRRDGHVFRETEYDASERIRNVMTFGPEGDVTGQEITKFNAAGDPILIQSRDGDGNLVWEQRRAIRQGKLLRAAQLDGEGQPIHLSSFIYDGNQLLQELAVTPHGDTVYVIDYRYDKSGERIFETYHTPQGNILNSHRYYYDEQGVLVREEIIDQHRLDEIVEYNSYPESLLRVATYYTPEGEMKREEISSDFGTELFAPRWND